MSAGNATEKNPIIISSQLWSPHLTTLPGSGLFGLLAELSKCAVHETLVPLGSRISLHRLIPELPAEIVARHAQDGLRLAGREDQAILEILAAQMHVRDSIAGQLHFVVDSISESTR